jgi:LysM repeat protein
VRTGEGWGTVAARAGVTVAALLAANAATTARVIHPDETLCLPAGASPAGSAGGTSAPPAAASAAGETYTVRAGDSWSGVAERSDVTLGALLSANAADADDLLMAGEQIRLPAGATRPAPAATWVTLDALPTHGPCWYGDTWLAPRGGGRRHQGVDIFTLPGQYVYAVADGRVRRYWDIPGRISGNAWMLTADDGSQYFYAHLAGFPPDVRSGGRVEAGQIIGWVGGTGNASAPHLHFEIRPGGGDPVNPNPILDGAGRCRSGQPYTQPSGWVPERVG